MYGVQAELKESPPLLGYSTTEHTTMDCPLLATVSDRRDGLL